LVDADQGAAVVVAPVSTTLVTVQKAAALTLRLQAPQLVEGFPAVFTATLTNDGGAQVDGLFFSALDLTDAAGGAVAATSVSPLPAGPLAGGAHASITFSVTPPAGAGTLTVHLRFTGVETNT